MVQRNDAFNFRPRFEQCIPLLDILIKIVEGESVGAAQCHIMLIEKKSTLHTGTEVVSGTRSLQEQLRPV